MPICSFYFRFWAEIKEVCWGEINRNVLRAISRLISMKYPCNQIQISLGPMFFRSTYWRFSVFYGYSKTICCLCIHRNILTHQIFALKTFLWLNISNICNSIKTFVVHLKIDINLELGLSYADFDISPFFGTPQVETEKQQFLRFLRINEFLDTSKTYLKSHDKSFITWNCSRFSMNIKNVF